VVRPNHLKADVVVVEWGEFFHLPEELFLKTQEDCLLIKEVACQQLLLREALQAHRLQTLKILRWELIQVLLQLHHQAILVLLEHKEGNIQGINTRFINKI
jgi:hypothetical protein